MLRYKFTLCCIALIWVLCFCTPPSVDGLDDVVGIDKVVHVLMYLGTCSILWWEYLRCHAEADWKKLLLLAVASPILMSGIIELLQEYATTHRGGDWWDFAANSLGVILAAIGGAVAEKARKCRHTTH